MLGIIKNIKSLVFFVADCIFLISFNDKVYFLLIIFNFTIVRDKNKLIQDNA